MLSVLVLNSAVVIAVPAMIFVAGLILTQMDNRFVYENRANLMWLPYTPLPYLQIGGFFNPDTPIYRMLQMNIPINLTYGILLLMGLSVVFTIVAAVSFRISDIKN